MLCSTRTDKRKDRVYLPKDDVQHEASKGMTPNATEDSRKGRAQSAIRYDGSKSSERKGEQRKPHMDNEASLRATVKGSDTESAYTEKCEQNGEHGHHTP